MGMEAAKLKAEPTRWDTSSLSRAK